MNCCEVLKLALERQSNAGVGLVVEIAMNMKTGASRLAPIIRFRRAKKTDTGKYGYGKPHANATFAPVVFCPFCGAKGCKRKTRKA